MTPESIYEFDNVFMDSITISNVFLHAKEHDITLFFEFLEENNIDYSTIDAYCHIIGDALKEFQDKDYDLQYTQSIIENGKIKPAKKYDTMVTMSLLKAIETITPDDIKRFNDNDIDNYVHSVQQVTVNALKFQLRYAYNMLYEIRTETFIWDTLGIS